MGAKRRSVKTRDPRELSLAFAATLFWAVAAFWSFWPDRRADLTPFAVSTLILVAVWVGAIVLLRARTARNKTLDELKALSPTEFEDWVAARFREMGYEVKLTGMGGDHGVDLLAEKPGELAVAQCKRYTSRSVGEPTLRDLFGAMHDFRAQHAYVVTTGPVSKAAQTWVRGKPIEIWDGDYLARLVRAAPMSAEAPTPATPQPAEETALTCPRCGAALVVRHKGKTGEPFLGCSRFPRCRHGQPMPQGAP